VAAKTQESRNANTVELVRLLLFPAAKKASVPAPVDIPLFVHPIIAIREPEEALKLPLPPKIILLSVKTERLEEREPMIKESLEVVPEPAIEQVLPPIIPEF
jgi:hypothetical protein